VCLERGEADAASWSARQALRVSPYDERLYRILMRAADAAGHPAGVESVLDELITLVAEDVEPFDAVHPETLELYRELSRRRRPSHAEAGWPRMSSGSTARRASTATTNSR
jgi:DNA-binding SARP family transcriptional activator